MQTPRKNKILLSKKGGSNHGFTLIEIMVAVSIFSLIMVISMGSILSVFDANKKSQTLRTVMDNMNFTLEGMTRTIRFGRNYHCGSGGDTTQPYDCPSGANSITLQAVNGSQIRYRLNGGRIGRTINNGTEYFVTSPDITIQSLAFRVFGSLLYNNGSDLLQPQVIITVKGFAGTKPSTQSSFSLETTVSQRRFDVQ